MIKAPIDVAGREICLGDEIVFMKPHSNNTSLQKAIVQKITPKVRYPEKYLGNGKYIKVAEDYWSIGLIKEDGYQTSIHLLDRIAVVGRP